MNIAVAHNIDAAAILQKRGLQPNGAAQRFLVSECDRYMIPYMPYRSGMQIKNRYLTADGVVYNGPYARYLYYGKVMVDSETGKGPAHIPDVGYRFRRGAVLKATSRDLEFDKTKNPLAGAFWDRRMWADNRTAILDAVQRYIEGK